MGGGAAAPATNPVAEARRSWAISVLRGSKQLKLGSGRFNATWVNHLGHCGAWEGSGRKNRWRGRICMAALAGAWHSGSWDDLRPTTTSAKGAEKDTDAHRELEAG
jgi:hypothetical protein